MVRVMKSPNMISTTGRSPVMAAPTATPVKPASEIGVSTTRFAPNSSTNPERTLKGVPASATSSPIMQTRESRRISSASASRTACANVSSRSGIDVHPHFVHAGIRSGNREFDRSLHDDANFRGNSIQCRSIGITAIDQPLRQYPNGIAVGSPELFLLLGAIVFAINIADVMAPVTVGVALQECRPAARTSAFHQTDSDFVHRAHILSISARGFDSESRGAAKDVPGGRFLIMRVLVVKIIFANVDYRQLPQL